MTTSTIYNVPEDCKSVDGEDLLDLIVFLECADIEYCDICGWSVNVRNVNGTKMCRHCIEKGIADGTLVSCSICGEVLRKEDAVLFDKGDKYQVFCQHCADEYIVECAECGKKFIREGYNRLYDDYGEYRLLCDECINHYPVCSECGRHYDYSMVDGMCKRCAESFRWYGDSYRYDYHDWEGYWNFYNDNGKITKHPIDRKTIYLGAELELNSYYESDYDDEDDSYYLDDCLNYLNDCLGGMAHYERDGSLNDGGIEIITMPMTLKQHMEHIANFREALNGVSEYNYGCDSGTGLHVHVSTTMMEDKHHKRLLYLLDKFQQNVVNLARRTSSYAEYHTIAETCGKRGEPDWQPSGYHIGKHFDWVKSHGDHYIYINYNGWENSIEFRMFKGTLDWKMYLGTIQFVHRCIEASMELTLNKLREMSFDDIFKGHYEELDYLIEKTQDLDIRVRTW